MSVEPTYTVLSGGRELASGSADRVAEAARSATLAGSTVLIFDDATGRQVELDPFADPPALAIEGAPPPPEPPRQGRGRPTLGVVAREVTLLPRHWDWLAAQPGGASAALRRLVDEARRSSEDASRARTARDALYRVMSTLAGDLPGFEEASRALFAGDDVRFDGLVADWPQGVRSYLQRLATVERGARL
ncbi:DUF2239 family protein [Phenylobacterium sp.]|jgi:hypothetical protein|uniref:DUF2239 family protein n=1 Tax=Phenylobacterium sp. TaxID=1871053 RepID=UPI002F9501AE